MKDGKKVILCIDDDKDFLDSMRAILEGSSDYHIETANSAADGLRAYKSVSPDLVLVDLMMEEVDSGTEVVKDMRTLGPTPPIIMLSSVGNGLSMNIDYTELGLSGVLQKPVNPATLLSTLKAKLS